MRVIRLGLLCCFAFTSTMLSHAQDHKGCSDSPLITRYPGSTIENCSSADFQQYDFLLDGGKKKHAEGQYLYLSYRIKPGVVTDLQLFRNIESALKTAGFTFDREVTAYSITAHHDKTWFYFVLHDTGGAAKTVASYEEKILTEGGMTQEVTANAAALSDDLTASGHTVVPGIYFDTGKADLKPESDASLKEIAKLLQDNPSLKVYVVGHTDNVGALAANVALSDQRAASVRKALITQYKISPERLQAHGEGPYAPVATNDTDDGRAKNRRVELVKQ